MGQPSDAIAPGRERVITRYSFSEDEVAMLRFLEICQPSLNPDHYRNVLAACEHLCGTRPSGMRKSSVEKCLAYLARDYSVRE
jgi:hypothetical protein